MNKEESVQYVAMQKLSYADTDSLVYETPFTLPGDEKMSAGFNCPLSVIHVVEYIHLYFIMFIQPYL